MLTSAPMPVTKVVGIGETELELISDEPAPAVTRGTASELDLSSLAGQEEVIRFFVLFYSLCVCRKLLGELGYR